MKKGPLTPKGFRDILPEAAKKRRSVINQIAQIFEEFGFVPLETPTIEFAETLLGKYGEEEKLIYQFTDRGGRKLALRYDLTVPLARFVANNQNLLIAEPFRRYQIGQVFRGENPQKGRFREFTQFDIDTVGSPDLSEDARVIAATIKAAKIVGFPDAKMAINDRANFKGLAVNDIREIDKIYKVGKENIKPKLLTFVEKLKPSNSLKELFGLLASTYELKEGEDFFFDPTLARGLDYYTSSIFELKPLGEPSDLSIAGGGRYDNLIGMFVYPDKGGAGRQIPAVGISFGIDRLLSLL